MQLATTFARCAHERRFVFSLAHLRTAANLL
jgi:hypothetical protein